MGNELRSKWEMVRLGDMCESKIDTIKLQDNKEIIYIDIASVDNQLKEISSYSKINILNAPSRAKQILKTNDILVSTVRPNLNAVAVNNIHEEIPVIASTGYCVLRCKSEILPQYLFAFCKANQFIEELVKVAKGASYPAVSNGDVKNLKIPLPPLEIQEKIAKNLDLASNLVKLHKTKLKELDKLIQSVFYDMFGDPVMNEMGWEVETIKNLCSKIGSGATPKGGKESYKDFGISLIRSMNVHNGYFKYKDLAFIDEIQAKQLDNVSVIKDDVLINITGASVARTCIVPEDILPARVNQHVSILRCKNSIKPIYLNCLLANDVSQLALLHIGTSNGATREAITKSQLEDFKMIVPPIRLQQKFSTIVTEIEKQKSQVQKALDDAEILYNSLMQEYFE
ncbi:MAG: restriction endonuclease subunit S [Eubacteriales bacterium]